MPDRTNLLEHRPTQCMEVGCRSGYVLTTLALLLGQDWPAGSVDVMVVNPPYLPTPEEEVGRTGIAASWAGGKDGHSVIDKILLLVDNLLADRDLVVHLYMVFLAANNPSEICLQMRQIFLIGLF
ncbi:hypothetical protein LguiA_009864 [Lonicera macranthoides]